MIPSKRKPSSIPDPKLATDEITECYRGLSKFGCYMNDGTCKIDFVLVYDVTSPNPDAETRRLWFQENLEKQGLELETERVKEFEKTLAFVKIHAPWKVLCRKAEDLQIKVPLKLRDVETAQLRTLKKSSKHFFPILNCRRPTNSMLIRTDSRSVINWPYKSRHLEMYALKDRETFFTNRQRIEIVWDILQKTPNNPNDNKKRGVASLLDRGFYSAAYPLHDGAAIVNEGKMTDGRNNLKSEWANLSSILHQQPLFEIRNYFGEKIGFYFGFMDFYAKWLVFPSAISFLALVLGIYFARDDRELERICNTDPNGTDPDNVADLWMCPLCEPPHCDPWLLYKEGCFQYKWAFRLDNEAGLVLSSLVILWAIFFLKFWRRRESHLAADWETHDTEDRDIILRPQYEQMAPKCRRNPVTLENEMYMPFEKKCLSTTLSVIATVFVLLIASACLLFLVMSRIFLYGALKYITGGSGRKNVELARWGIHGMIFVVIFVIENFYDWLADKLTLYECPKTDNQFMNSFLWKLFIFKLLNDFVPIGYAAFVKGKTVSTPLQLNFLSELCDGGCIGEVTELVAVLLLARLLIGNVVEFGIPYVKNAFKRCRAKVGEEDQEPRWLKDFHLNEAHLDGVYKEYMEMMIQFAFIVFFTPAFPAAPLICFLNNIFEIRIDAINLLKANRRPVPIRVSGIAIWNRFMDIIIKMGIVCQAALMSFSSDNIPRLYYKYYYKPGQGHVGYTKFSLSSIPVEFWHDKAVDMLSRNITECWYPDWRDDNPPFKIKPVFWHIFTIRLISFSLFCLTFFLIMWLVNTTINDIPKSARTRVQRRVYLVNKFNEIHPENHNYHRHHYYQFNTNEHNSEDGNNETHRHQTTTILDSNDMDEARNPSVMSL